MRLAFRLLTILMVCCLVAGCGPSRVKARGRLVKSGQPFLPGDNETVHIAFFPAADDPDPSAHSYVVSFNRADGTFQVVGKDGKGLPPGKYRVAVSLIKDRKDQLKGAFNVKSSPVLCEVKSASEEIIVDLATPSTASPATKPVQPVRKSRA
jgi:hypothetical protein